MNGEEIKVIRIQEAIGVLHNNGYAVVKMTKRMQDAADECGSMAEDGKDKDCDGCPCNICLIQPYE